MYRRVIVVIADGLRPDAVTAGRMATLWTIGADYTTAVSARTWSRGCCSAWRGRRRRSPFSADPAASRSREVRY